MKTKKSSLSGSLLFLLLIAVSVLYFSSCGGKKTGKGSEAITVDSVPAGEMAYTEVDEMPVYNGGDSALLSFIAKNTSYPEEAKKNNIQGRVLIGFVVEKDGSVSEAKILKGVDPLLDAEAIRVVQSLPKFGKPGIKNGVQVRVKYMVPITYALR
jgi:TonB family protein